MERRINIILKNYINDEVERFSTNIISRAISDVMRLYEKEDLVIFDSDSNNKLTYNTAKINEIQSNITNNIEKRLSELDSGYIDESFLFNRLNSSKFRYIKEGILCEVSVGAVNNSILFTNVGPTIPIRLFFSSQFSSDIEIETKEYGINNIMVTFFLVVNIKEQINMPLTSKIKKMKFREPISVEIIKGEVPNYYNKY